MQTFLPHPNFACSALVLDRARLGKQRLEAKQILIALVSGGGWKNHPAVKMWRGHEPALKFYHDVMIREWERRGYKNTMATYDVPDESIVMPSWMGREDFHAAHRAALLAKDPSHYAQFDWTEAPAVDYLWP